MDKAKFEAAVTFCGANATEAQIKADYVKRAGLVRGADKDDWKKGVGEEVNDSKDLSVKELRALAEEKGIDYTGLNKAELIEALK